MFKDALAFLCACGVVTAALPATASDSTRGIAFDQVERTAAYGERPLPSSFQTDYELALKVAKNGYTDPGAAARGAMSGARGASMAASAASMIPGIGGIIGGFAAGAAARAQRAAMRKTMSDAMHEQTAGTLTHYAFLNGWERVEKPGVSAIIVKPDLKQTIYLDLHNKTFVRYGSVEDAAPEAPAGGAGTLQSSLNVTELAAPSIERHATNLAESTYHLLLTGGSGACEDGTAEVHARTYYAQDLMTPARLSAKDGAALESLALQPGCSPKIVRQGAAGRDEHLYLFRIVDVNGGAQESPASAAFGGMLGGGGPAGVFGRFGGVQRSVSLPSGVPGLAAQSAHQRSYTHVTERGNLVELGANDTALFDVPADFTEAK
ncbi:MAG: hypothetical protein NVSMB5_15560 [Candidatus Velthaea sp.]